MHALLSQGRWIAAVLFLAAALSGVAYLAEKQAAELTRTAPVAARPAASPRAAKPAPRPRTVVIEEEDDPAVAAEEPGEEGDTYVIIGRKGRIEEPRDEDLTEGN